MSAPMRKNISNIVVENTLNSGSSAAPAKRVDFQTPDSPEKIAHDIRGAINVIIGYSHIMLDEANGKINPQQREALLYIVDYSNRLNDLTDEIVKRLKTDL
jgi:light-regulated signal transduction histidine kinase (bacteriophytochrome)